MAKYLPKPRGVADQLTHYEDGDFGRDYPALYELLCLARKADKFRPGAKLSIFADAGRLKASIWDPDTDQVWYATLDGFQGALEAIERLLQNGQGEWRQSRKNGR